MEDHHRLMRQIGKAAAILDLKGDFARAIEVLKGVLDDAAVERFLPTKLEALVFLADVYRQMEEGQEAGTYVRLAEDVDVSGLEPDLVERSLERLAEIKLAVQAPHAGAADPGRGS